MIVIRKGGVRKMSESIEPVYMRVAEALKFQRLSAGLSQAKLAEVLNIPTNTYRGYETGQRRIQLHTLVEVARYYNLSVNYFMDYGLESESATNKIVLELEDTDVIHAVNDLRGMDAESRKSVYDFMEFVSKRRG